ncbi:hypothetical protein [Mangrovibacterium diazotrophicum]|uniref:Uncharacterized protein n=1 Tax=Mangrovibacterium diazotrophicum TaxID=1261403 RepID=A0A419WBU6_9BACT|nr:hypothetical protein [Mangrovibacterium diazotrophicum]RKD92866.1 hypothetical protein BC643_3243 [Mangrovibacterium diazotrophicum]
MHKQLLALALITITLSCSNDKSKVAEQNTNQQTPDALVDDNKIDVSSYSKRYDSDIIQQLFDEAVETNESLKSLTSDLKKVREHKSDSLMAYEIYRRNNQDYWNTLARYSSQLSDSTLRQDLNKLIETLKAKQLKKTAQLDEVASQVDSATQKLNDLEILMKILVTQPMMSNYQRNELPNLKTVESVKEALESSIKQLEPYAKIQE